MFCASRAYKSAIAVRGYNLDNSRRSACVDRQSRLSKSSASCLLLFVMLALAVSSARAQEIDWYPDLTRDLGIERSFVYSSLYTTHYDPKPEHVNDQNMLGFEIETEEKQVFGLSVFDNSFGQKSKYLYMGQKWHNFSSERAYFKLTGGLLHGYKEPYDDKIPFNDLGVAPVLVPTFGYQHKGLAIEFSQLGLAAGMITAGFTF